MSDNISFLATKYNGEKDVSLVRNYSIRTKAVNYPCRLH